MQCLLSLLPRSVESGIPGFRAYHYRTVAHTKVLISTASPGLVTIRSRSYNIFNEAMSAVLKIMDTNFSYEFKRTEAFKNLEQVVKEEAEELELLRKVRARISHGQPACSLLLLWFGP